MQSGALPLGRRKLGENGLAPREEPLSVMDLEKRVSRQRQPVPTALRCCQAGNLWVSVFKDRTATLGMLEFHRKKNEERGVSPSSLDKTSETMSAGSIQLPTPVSSRHAMCSPNTKECSAPATPFVWAFTLGRCSTFGTAARDRKSTRL